MQGTAELYKEFADYFTRSSIASDAMRNIKWGITKFLVKIVDACDGLLDQCYKLTSFIFSDSVQNYLSQYKAVLYVLFAAALMLFAWQMMLVRKQDRSKLLQGLTISLMIIIGLPTLMSNVNTLSKYGIEFVNSNYNTNARAIVQGCTTDLLYLDANNFTLNSDTANTAISKKDIMNIEINSTVYGSDDGIKNGDVFKHYLDKDSSGKDVLKDIDDGGITSLNDDVYYRFTLDYTTIFFTLLATAIVILFTSFKCIQIIYDIIVNQFLATVLSATDWQTGQKMKETLKAIGGGFFTLFFVSFSLKLYMMFSSYVSSQVNNGIQKGIILIIGAIAVIHGPNLVEKILGIDAGLSSMFRTISTLYFGSRAVAGVAGAAGRAVGSAAGMAGGILGAGKGLVDTLRNRESNNQNGLESVSENASTESTSDTNSSSTSSDTRNSENNLSSGGDTTKTPSEGAKSNGDSAVGNKTSSSSDNSQSKNNLSANNDLSNTSSDGSNDGNNSASADTNSSNNTAPESENTASLESGGTDYQDQDIGSISNNAPSENSNSISDSSNNPPTSSNSASESISDSKQENSDKSENGTQNNSESVSEGAAQMQRDRHNNSALGDAVSRSRGIAGRSVRGYRDGVSIGEEIGNRINNKISDKERKRNLK